MLLDFPDPPPQIRAKKPPQRGMEANDLYFELLGA